MRAVKWPAKSRAALACRSAASRRFFDNGCAWTLHSARDHCSQTAAFSQVRGHRRSERCARPSGRAFIAGIGRRSRRCSTLSCARLSGRAFIAGSPTMRGSRAVRRVFGARLHYGPGPLPSSSSARCSCAAIWRSRQGAGRGGVPGRRAPQPRHRGRAGDPGPRRRRGRGAGRSRDSPPGTYTVFCAIDGHRAGGMEAQVVVGGPDDRVPRAAVSGCPSSRPGRRRTRK